MKVHFSEEGWEDYQHWCQHDRTVLDKINALIEDTRRRPFTGLGKPEPLKAALSGWWSRRITGEHRLVYRVAGAGAEQRIEIVQCRYHY
ncbi:ribosome-dependent mRNA interferase toxin YoeB [Rhodovastum atsumiense]|uniref:Putative mRNA interferase YoeB n=1 Tax=Rhodovastum atsumiense TaxID=504468 RepID=A0A5M6ITY8_9PROT|nr:Txe/YoeB family addiction module toxin [Rhodovastum atsumiense]KAA5610895.1 Txe/YoeB family addiction module toxin [Rhodovastum atsumiense]CAH2601540.1 ribosome-dependent mRNA interferase toxin YoeB [Rhodovastum atsumiense]